MRHRADPDSRRLSVMVLFTTGSRLNCTRVRGFTLIEIMIVAALLAIFAGIAIFGARQMYNHNRRKAMFDETRQIGAALSLARDDLGFFPRIYLLDFPLSMVSYQTANNNVKMVRPAFDTYGMYSSVGPQANMIANQWRGPYMPFSSSKGAINFASKAFVKMRLSDREFQSFKGPNGEDLSVVSWPTDTWNNPYVFYEIYSDPKLVSTANPAGLRLIRTPTEIGNYFTAVVSYGPNRFPGGIREEKQTPGVAVPTTTVAQALISVGLYVQGDLAGGNAEYTLKSFTSAYPDALIDNAFIERVGRSLQTGNPLVPGILDPDSDDIIWRF
jgi:prepilin-type N-terminal cleavage/methylation domain-containing protein